MQKDEQWKQKLSDFVWNWWNHVQFHILLSALPSKYSLRLPETLNLLCTSKFQAFEVSCLYSFGVLIMWKFFMIGKYFLIVFLSNIYKWLFEYSTKHEYKVHNIEWIEMFEYLSENIRDYFIFFLTKNWTVWLFICSYSNSISLIVN